MDRAARQLPGPSSAEGVPRPGELVWGWGWKPMDLEVARGAETGVGIDMLGIGVQSGGMAGREVRGDGGGWSRTVRVECWVDRKVVVKPDQVS